ncbi:very short patch repair endonuclease [Litchfieldella rifensis]|uniref:Very short patch repair endonuclease n=1 Tax=Litchfieldella rifensis TaxID=762643 RepID=A0ABV7LU44_9GAMM
MPISGLAAAVGARTQCWVVIWLRTAHCNALFLGFVPPVGTVFFIAIAAMDTVSRSRRSQIMARVRAKDTKPEMHVRRLIHGMGYRYRLHARDLPGRPDLVFRSRRRVIFVHGCFWHRHPGCSHARIPKSRTEFWRTKLEGNRRRDVMNRIELRRLGWRSLVIWECQLKDEDDLRRKIRSFLDA